MSDLPAQIEKQLKTIAGLQAQLERIPPAPLSKAAEVKAEEFSVEDTKIALGMWIEQAKQHRAEAKKKLEAVEEPLNRLEKFKGALSNKRNRRTMCKLIEEVKSLDACNPVAEQYQALVDRMGGCPK